MTDTKKPSEKVISNLYDGHELTDKSGKKLTLRKPTVLDRYDLMSALGDDAKNPMCLSFALPLLHIAKIDGDLMESARSIAQFRANLFRVGDDGINAVIEYMNIAEENFSEQEQKNKIKK